jgi:hypothetical protein
VDLEGCEELCIKDNIFEDIGTEFGEWRLVRIYRLVLEGMVGRRLYHGRFTI